MDPHFECIDAIHCNHYNRVVKLINDTETDLSFWSNHHIALASKLGRCKMVELFLCHAKVNQVSNNNGAIIYASEKGHEKVVDLLLEDARIDPMSDDNLAIIEASKNGHDKVVELL